MVVSQIWMIRKGLGAGLWEWWVLCDSLEPARPGLCDTYLHACNPSSCHYCKWPGALCTPANCGLVCLQFCWWSFCHPVAIDDSNYHFVILLSMVSGIRSGSVGCRPWLLLNLLQLEIVFHVAVCTWHVSLYVCRFWQWEHNPSCQDGVLGAPYYPRLCVPHCLPSLSLCIHLG